MTQYNSNSPEILSSLNDNILTLKFNRPDKKNAILLSMYASLTTLLQQAKQDDNVKVIFFTGTDNCFTAGNDLADFLQNPPKDETSPPLQFINTIASYPKPMLAAINGNAVGIGATMLLHCDLVYTGPDLKLQMPFINLGACPEAGSSLLLTSKMGYNLAAELLLLGKTIDAKRAQQLGLVNEIFPEDYAKNAYAIALNLSQKPMQAMLATKALMRQANAKLLPEIMLAENKQFMQLINSAEAKAIMQKFFAKP